MVLSGKNKIPRRLLISPLAAFLTLICQSPAHAEVYFNPRFLSDDPGAVANLSQFENGLEAPPGKYRVDIYLNKGFMATREVDLRLNQNKTSLDPCISLSQLSEMGVNILAFPGAAAQIREQCVPFSSLSKQVSSHFDAGKQRLDLTVPQAMMRNSAQGYIPPELWDNGINAGLLNYSLSGSRAKLSDGETSNYSYLSLQSGFNLGAWRFRDNSNWSYSESQNYHQNQWKHTNTYVERSIIPLRSRLTLGDGYTTGDVFDSVNFRGAQLASDDTMLPDSLRGFAPVIHGIARSSAKISVRQNGYTIYQTTVPPGPFTINDINANGNSGDLHVTITEADGSTRTSVIPYATVPVLQREGHLKYAVTAGEYRSGTTGRDSPKFAQGTALWGLSAGITAYGGTQQSDNYHAYDLGMGKNLGDFGAVSFDVMNANSVLTDGSSHQGQSYRFQYNKSLPFTGTNFQLVGYRYSTKGFYSFSDTTWQRMSGYSVLTQDGVLQVKPTYTDFYNLEYTKRGQIQASVTQQIAKSSTIYFTGSQQSYWGTSRKDTTLQAGYSSNYKDISYSFNYSLNKSAWQQGNDQVLSFDVSIPFSHWMKSNDESALKQANISYSSSSNLKGESTNQVGVYGTLLKDNNLSYSAQTGYTAGSPGDNGAANNASLYYRGGYGNANVGYSNSDGYNQVYYGASGGVVAHANGITFSQPLSDTSVLIKAPGADNVSLQNQTGVHTDWRGYAVQPYAMSYRENRIALDPNTLGNNVDVDDSVVTVIPTYGAIVRADFHTHVGLKVLMTLTHNGKPVPFGATATLAGSASHNIVGDSGQVYMTGLPLEGKINVNWGDGASEQCTVSYHLPASAKNVALSYASADCQ